MYSLNRLFHFAIPALAAVSIFSGIGLAHAATAPKNNVLLIFDSSGSMKKVIEGRSRMASAKAAVASAMPAIPANTRVGLMVFGHRRAKDCSDIELVSPIGAESAQAVAAHVAMLQPKGETPIAAAIEAGAKKFAALKGQNNAILLITDGIEECGGDPCAAAKQVKAAGLDLKVNVVGLNLNGQQRATIECLVKETGGKFFSADKAADFARTLKAAVEVAQADVKPTPAPPKPALKRVFFDDFNGKELAKHWTVTNPDPDAYLVEDGRLLMFSGQTTGFDQKNMANLISLNTKLPDGDWDAIVKFSGELKSGRDRFWIGLRKDEKNYVAADLMTKFNVADDYHGDWINLDFQKHSHGRETKAPKNVFSGSHDAEYKEFVGHMKNRYATFILSKRGRSYLASLTIDGVEDGKHIRKFGRPPS